MKRWNPPAILVAVCAAVLLLAACGDSSDGTQSSSAPAADARGTSEPASEAVEVATGSAPKQSIEKKRRGSDKPTTDPTTKSEPKTVDTNAVTQQQGQAAPKPVHIKGCPAGMSKSQCEQVGLATQQKGSDSHVVAKDECPAAMSQGECRQAGAVYEEAPEGQVVQPNECPRAMTAEQCAEAGKAYEEATK